MALYPTDAAGFQQEMGTQQQRSISCHSDCRIESIIQNCSLLRFACTVHWILVPREFHRYPDNTL